MFLGPKAYLVGLFRGLTSVKCVLILYAANLLVAALVSVPVYELAADHLAPSPATRDLLNRYDDAFVGDALSTHAATLDAAASTVKVATIITFLLNMFLLGGVISALSDRHRPRNFTTFFSACGRHLLPFLRVMIPAGLVIWLLSVLNDRAGEGLTWYFNEFQGRAASAEWLGAALIGKAALFLLLYGLLVKMPVAFARVRCVVDDDRGMLRGYGAGVSLCLRNPLTVTVFLLLFALTAAALFLGHDYFLRHMDLSHDWHPLARLGFSFNPALDPTTVLLFGSQLFILLQQCLTVLFVAGALEIYRESSEPPPEPDPELVYARSQVAGAAQSDRRRAATRRPDHGDPT